MITFSAREQHFADHLHPIWEALPAELRGPFHVGDGVTVPGAPTVPGWPAAGGGPVVCAAWGDLREVRRLGRPVVLCEHGAGQSYAGTRHASYAGGKGREAVVLFVVPNEQAAARNRRWWPKCPNVVVGSPKLDRLRLIPPPAGPPVAALSFHWRCKVVPEAGTAWDHYAAGLAHTRRDLEAAGVTLIGHAHPRMFAHAAPLYEQAGIEPVRRFEEVVARAHALAVDNSSVLFEFAALDRPVAVLNSPRFRRNAHHGLRFWDEAGVGVNVDQPAGLAAGILHALEDPPARQDARRASTARVYPAPPGMAARLAADAIAAHTGALVA